MIKGQMLLNYCVHRHTETQTHTHTQTDMQEYSIVLMMTWPLRTLYDQSCLVSGISVKYHYDHEDAGLRPVKWTNNTTYPEG